MRDSQSDPAQARPPHAAAAVHYFPALDGIRGLMAISILVFHVHMPWFPGAPITMDIFFVISGFLITLILQRNVRRAGSVQLARFWKRRLQRLYPVMLTVVVSTSVVACFVVEDIGPVLNDAVHTALYVSNWPKLHNYVYPTMFGHSWSLSIEEQFYVLWPLLFLLALKTRLYWKGMLAVLAGVAVAVVAWRLHLVADGVPWSRLYYALETRMDAFIIGGALAFGWSAWRRDWAHRDWAHWLTLGCAAGLAAMLVAGTPRETGYFVWQQSLVLFFAAGTVLLLSSPRASWLRDRLGSRYCAALGLRSYGIYLWHWPLIWLLHMSTTLAGWRMLLVVLPATLVLSAITYQYIEKPALQRRVFYQATASD